MGNQKRGKCWVRDWNPSVSANVTSDPAEASTSQPDNYFVGDSGSEGEMDVDQHDGGSDELQLHIETAPEDEQSAERPTICVTDAQNQSEQLSADDQLHRNTGQPLTVLFDMNGVLVTERGDQRTGYHRPRREFTARPNVGEIVRLLPRYRLGVFSSATKVTVDRGLEQVLEAVWQAHGKTKAPGFVCPRTVMELFPIVYHRSQTLPNTEWRTVPGGTEWDTTKPLDLNGLDSTRTLLVDNELYKAHRGEEDSIVMIPTWEALADQGLSSWDALIDGLLAVPPNTASLQGYSNQLTHSCAAAAATPALDHPYHAAAAARAAEALLEREVMRNAAQAAAAAAAASAAAPTVREAASTAKYEIWFPQTAEEVEAWNAVMGLVAGMAKQRAVETVRAKEEKAERIAAEMVNAGEGEEELTARLRQQQHQQPPLFDGYGVAVEHLEVVVSLGLLNRSRTFCDVSIRNAARIQKAGERGLSLQEAQMGCAKTPGGFLQQPTSKWTTIKKFVKDIDFGLHHALGITTNRWETLLDGMVLTGKLRCSKGHHTAGSTFEAITIPTLEATQAAVAACKQHYAALTQPQQPAGAEHNADAACMVGSVRSAGHNSLPAGADSHANSEAPAKDGFELAVAAQPRSWSPSSAEEVQRLSGLMAYCRSLSAARIRTDEIRQDEAGQQLVPVSDLSVRLQLSLQVTAGGAGAFGHVQILILMALLRASPSCSNGKVNVSTGGSGPGLGVKVARFEFHVKSLGGGLELLLPASPQLMTAVSTMVTKGWLRRPTGAARKRYEATHIPTVETATAAIAALTHQYLLARSHVESVAAASDSTPAAPAKQNAGDRDDEVLLSVQKRLHAENMSGDCSTSPPLPAPTPREQILQSLPASLPAALQAVTGNVSAYGPRTAIAMARVALSRAVLVGTAQTAVAADKQLQTAEIVRLSPAPTPLSKGSAANTSLKRSRMLAGAQPLNDNFRHRQTPSAGAAGSSNSDTQAEQSTQLSPLHHEVASFALHASSSELELQQLDIAMRSVQTVVASIWPHARAVLFGSQASGLSLPGSDLDIVILGVIEDLTTPAEGFRQGKSSALKLLKVLSKQLKSAGVIRDLEIINAKVPIVKTRLTLQHPNDSHHSTSSYSGQPGHRSTTSGRKFSFAADISMGVANGVAAVYLVRRMVELMPPLRPLVLVLKACLKEAGLNEVFTGGLSSYSLVNLAIAHLQCEGYDTTSALTASSVSELTPKHLKRPHSHSKKTSAPETPSQDPNGRNVAIQGLEPESVAYLRGVRSSASAQLQGALCSDLGTLLKSFCSRFGNVFDYHKEAVSVVGGGVVEKAYSWHQSHKLALAVEDPQQQGKDIGAGSYNASYVQELFSSSLDALMASESRTASRSTPSSQHPAAAEAGPGTPLPHHSLATGSLAGGSDEEDTWRSVQEDGSHGSLPSVEEHHGIGYDSGEGRAGQALLTIDAYCILSSVLDVGAALGLQSTSQPAAHPSWPNWIGDGGSEGPAGDGGSGPQAHTGSKPGHNKRKSSSSSHQQGLSHHHHQNHQEHPGHHRRDSQDHSHTSQQQHSKRQRGPNSLERPQEADAGTNWHNSHARGDSAGGREAAGGGISRRQKAKQEAKHSAGNRKQVDGKSPRKIAKQQKKKVRVSHEPKAKNRGGWSAD